MKVLRESEDGTVRWVRIGEGVDLVQERYRVNSEEWETHVVLVNTEDAGQLGLREFFMDADLSRKERMSLFANLMSCLIDPSPSPDPPQ